MFPKETSQWELGPDLGRLAGAPRILKVKLVAVGGVGSLEVLVWMVFANLGFVSSVTGAHPSHI